MSSADIFIQHAKCQFTWTLKNQFYISKARNSAIWEEMIHRFWLKILAFSLVGGKRLNSLLLFLGPVVQSVVSLMSSLRVIWLLF